MMRLLVVAGVLTCFWTSALAADVLHLGAIPEGEVIRVPAGETLVIDTSGLDWSGPPPALIVLQRFSDYYVTHYRAETTRYTLNVATLTPRDAPPFAGLSAGDAAYLMIGREPVDGGLARGLFLPDRVWYLEVVEGG